MEIVIFDLDDTLYDRSLPLKRVFQDFIGSNSLSFELFCKYYEMNSDIAFLYEKEGKMSLHESRLFRIKKSFKDINFSIKETEAKDFLDKYYAEQNNIVLFPRVPYILNYLEKQGKDLAIITNGPKEHQIQKIKKLQLDKWFELNNIITSGEVGIAKPDIEIFRLAERRFGCKSNDIWFIGDSYFHDVDGACNANWNVVWFNHRRLKIKPNPNLNKINKIVYSDAELEEYLYKIF